MTIEFNEEMPFDPDLLTSQISDEIASHHFCWVHAGKAKATRVTNKGGTIGDFLPKILNHTEGQKDGSAAVLGRIVGKARKADAMAEEHAIGLDFDNGTPIEEIKSALQSNGLFAVLYTTHSHLKAQTEISCNALIKYRDETSPNTSIEDASIAYLRDMKNYHVSVIATCKFVGRQVTVDGEAFIVEHAPMDKVRVVIFLEKPFNFIDAAPAQREAQMKWKAILRGTAKMLGVQIDEACLDPARIFYLPRHRRGARFQTWCNTEGRLLDWTTIDPVDLPKSNGRREHETTRNDHPAWLMKWAATTAPRFLMAAMFRDHAPDHVRRDHSEGKMTVECPFDGEHSNPGDRNDEGCFVRDAEADPSRPTSAFQCSHNSCKGRDRLDFIAEAIEQDWFQKECLFDESYQIEEDDAGSRSAEDQQVNGQDARRDRGFGFDLPRGYVGRKWDDGTIFMQQFDEDDTATPVCRAFEVLGAASDTGGGSAMIITRFVDAQGNDKEVSYNRAELARHTPDVAARFEDQWFTIYDRKRFGDLLGQIIAKSTITLVPRTGWHGQHFLTVGGETIGEAGIRLRLKSGVAVSDVTGGTPEGWSKAVAPIFESDAVGWEHLALGVLAGGAGPVASFLQDTGMLILSLHGLSSRGKSTALRLAASAGAAPNESGAFATLRATDNGVEGILPSRSGITLCFDEGQHADPNTLKKLAWMIDSGSGKRRADERGNARPVQGFGGYAMFSNEIALTDLIRQGGASIPQGLHARICDINISDVVDLDPDRVARVITGPRAGVEANYGHVVPVLAARLVAMTRDEVSSAVDDWIGRIIGCENAGLQRRSATPLAVVGIAGNLMQDAGLIPADFDILRVLQWAWVRRPEAAMSDPVDTALDRLAHSINALRGVEIFEVAEMGDRHPREAKGWFHQSDVHGAFCALSPDAMVEMAGGTIPRTVIVRALGDRGLLIPCGTKNKLHRKVNGKIFTSYRIRSPFYEEEPERGE